MVDTLTPTPRYRRALPLTWTVACVVVAVALVALWVRSYQGTDAIYWQTTTTRTVLFSVTGVLGASKHNFKAIPEWGWTTIQTMPGTQRTWAFSSDNYGTRLRFPYRLPIAICVLLAVAPWVFQLPRRFSLRTLLIATTLLSVLLGLVVWLTH